MTGYGAAEVRGLRVEVRSLNHRHADITLRAPTLFAAHEVPIRALVKERFSRGKFDVTVSVTAAQEVQVRLNIHMARALHEAFLELQRERGIGGGPTLEIFQYARSEPRSPAAANREGIAHLAFEVEDVEKQASAVIEHGGRKIGDIASSEVGGVGLLTFAYMADPEGNIIELLSWRHSQAAGASKTAGRSRE